jgi:hypothetical protein
MDGGELEFGRYRSRILAPELRDRINEHRAALARHTVEFTAAFISSRCNETTIKHDTKHAREWSVFSRINDAYPLDWPSLLGIARQPRERSMQHKGIDRADRHVEISLEWRLKREIHVAIRLTRKNRRYVTFAELPRLRVAWQLNAAETRKSTSY